MAAFLQVGFIFSKGGAKFAITYLTENPSHSIIPEKGSLWHFS